MARYTDGVDEIEAILFTGSNFQEIWEAFGRDGIETYVIRRETVLRLRTITGQPVFVRHRDWVAKDISPNTFFQIDPRTFNKHWWGVTEDEQQPDTQAGGSS